VDLVLGDAADGSRDFAIEINPRLTTSYLGLRALARGSLAAALLRAVRGDEQVLSTFVPYAASEAMSLVYAKCRVLDSLAVPRGLRLRVQGPAEVIARLRAALRKEAR
jgi:hypothetical protein